MAAGLTACAGGSLADLRANVSGSGWSAAARTASGTRYVPVVQVTIANAGHVSVDDVDVFLSFWQAGADGENDTQQIAASQTRDIAAGASTAPLVVRSGVGYDLAGDATDLFSHSQFRDWTVKIYARRAGRLVPLGDFPIARRMVGTFASTGVRPFVYSAGSAPVGSSS
jgi:anti-sigma factor RsiW